MLVFSRGTIDDCELVDGLVLTQRVVNSGLSRVEKAKIGLIQFCLSPPKTDVRTATTSVTGHGVQTGFGLFLSFFRKSCSSKLVCVCGGGK